MFREHDEELLRRQHAVHRDEEALIQSAREAARELEDLFESDRPATPRGSVRPSEND